MGLLELLNAQGVPRGLFGGCLGGSWRFRGLNHQFCLKKKSYLDLDPPWVPKKGWESRSATARVQTPLGRLQNLDSWIQIFCQPPPFDAGFRLVFVFCFSHQETVAIANRFHISRAMPGGITN